MNLAGYLRSNALAFPDKRAVSYATGRDSQGALVFEHKTYLQLDRESDALAFGLQKMGIGLGTKTILMVKAGPELVTIIFALFKVGAVPVVVDPGMGIRRMMHCYKTVGAEAFIGIPLAHAIRSVFFNTFSSVKKWVTVGRRWMWGGPTLRDLFLESDEPFPIAETRADDLLIVNFTTGSTGPAKGVEYTHGTSEGTLMSIRALLDYGEDSVTLATLPLFAIFDVLLGFHTVFPSMDPTKPAQVDPQSMIDTMAQFNITHMFASPAFLHRVGEYAREQGVKLDSLRVVVSGGAPVSVSVMERFCERMGPDAKFYTVYGATEALPMAAVESREIRSESGALTRQGMGTCVGYPVQGLSVRTIPIGNEPISTWSEDLHVEPGQVGEITVSGPMVSPRYHRSSRWNELMKIHEGDRVWHRTGDLGSIDEKGRIWFCGRKSESVITENGSGFTSQWEGIIDGHPDVYRSALVAVGDGTSRKPVVCVELREEKQGRDIERIERELQTLASQFPVTRQDRLFLFHPSLPVDIRHNAKINREALGHWAAGVLGYRKRGPLETRHWLRLIPILGWLYILVGIVWPFDNNLLYALWVLDILLSVGAHGLQVPAALSKGKKAGYSAAATVFNTFLYGATWWRTLEPRPLGPKHGVRASVT